LRSYPLHVASARINSFTAFHPCSYALLGFEPSGEFATTCRQKKTIQVIALGPEIIPFAMYKSGSPS